MEQKYTSLDRNIQAVEQQIQTHNIQVHDTVNRTTAIENNIGAIKMENDRLLQENYELRERIIEMQTRSMRDNLIFKGIPDVVNYKEPENTEAKLKTFISTELGIEEDIPFHVVHRL